MTSESAVAVSELSDDELTGLKQAITGAHPALAFTPAMNEAIAAGLVFDADPTWMYADRGAHMRAGVTEAGRKIAVELGWVCGCQGCAPHLAAAPEWCGGCGGSARAFGVIEGKCGMHWLMAHPEVVAERGRLKNPKWLPEGITHTTFKDWLALRVLNSPPSTAKGEPNG